MIDESDIDGWNGYVDHVQQNKLVLPSMIFCNLEVKAICNEIANSSYQKDMLEDVPYFLCYSEV